MRGIEFSGCNSYTNLFKEICIDNYDWYIYDDEIIINHTQHKINGYISASELKKLISDPEVLIVFMNLQAFPNGAPAQKVYDYDDYISSFCSFVVLVTDASCVEIYTRTVSDCLSFLRSATYCQGRKITIKTADNDTRTNFMIT